MKKRITYLLAFFLTLVGHPQLHAQEAGDLDLSFGVDGNVITDLGNGYDLCTGLVIQPDQKVVIGGIAQGGDGYSHPTLIRMNTDGTLDNTFGNAGVASTDALVGASYGTSDPLIIQPDGKLLFAFMKFQEGERSMAVIRFNSDGSIDSTFGVDGVASVLVFEYYDYVTSVVLQPDGKILVVGYGHYFSGNSFKMCAVRFNDDGSLDESFADNGIFIYADSDGSRYIMDVKLQSDGKIVMAGHWVMTGYYQYGILRLNEDGSFDDTFGTDGISLINVTNGYDVPQYIRIRPDGSILIGGSATAEGSSENILAMICLNANGTLDENFGNNGIVLSPLQGLFNAAESLVVADDGKILLVGHHEESDVYGAVLRYNADGTLDTTFGVNGVSLLGEDGGSYHVENVRQQNDGKIVVCGWTGYSDTNEHHFTASRLHYDDVNAVMETWSKEPVITLYPNPTSDKLFIRISEEASKNIARISITDSIGKLIWQSSQANQNTSLDMSHFAEGLYFLSVQHVASTSSQTFVVAR